MRISDHLACRHTCRHRRYRDCLHQRHASHMVVGIGDELFLWTGFDARDRCRHAFCRELESHGLTGPHGRDLLVKPIVIAGQPSASTGPCASVILPAPASMDSTMPNADAVLAVCAVLAQARTAPTPSTKTVVIPPATVRLHGPDRPAQRRHRASGTRRRPRRGRTAPPWTQDRIPVV